MDSWHSTVLGLRQLPREVTAFKNEVFFQFSANESRIIEERRLPELKLGLALQIGFLRMWTAARGGSDRPAAVVAASGRALRRGRCRRRLASGDVSPRADIDRAPAAGLRGARVCATLALRPPTDHRPRTAVARDDRRRRPPARSGTGAPYRAVGRAEPAGTVAHGAHRSARLRVEPAELAVGAAGQALLPPGRGDGRSHRAAVRAARARPSGRFPGRSFASPRGPPAGCPPSAGALIREPARRRRIHSCPKDRFGRDGRCRGHETETSCSGS